MCTCDKDVALKHKADHHRVDSECIRCLRDVTGIRSKARRTLAEWGRKDREMAQGLVGRLYRDFYCRFKVPDNEIYLLGTLVECNITPKIAGIVSAVYGCEILRLIMDEHIRLYHM